MFATNLFKEVNRDFDTSTVTDRAGYPPVQHKSQGWRAQRHLTFCTGTDRGVQVAGEAGDVEVAKRIVCGGKVYTASTG